MMMANHGGCGCERQRRAHKRNAMLLKELLNTCYVRADNPSLCNHERLVPIANVVAEQHALKRST